MLLSTRRLSHTLLQSSRFNLPLRHYFKACHPLVPGLNFHHGTSAGSAIVSETSSLPETQDTQSKMKALIEDELRGATYHVDLTNEDGILHADPTIVEAVNDSLRTTFQVLTSGGSSSTTNPRLPVNGFICEHRSYKPLAHLLNKIIDTANWYMPRSQLSELHFHPLVPVGEVKETYSHRGLKLGCAGIIGKLSAKMKKPTEEPANKPELSWGQIEVHIGSKASVRDMLQQSGTYAHFCLLNNQRHSFSLGIGFDYKKLEAYVLVFHRSGLSSSQPLKLSTGKGFKDLVKHIVGILSFKEEAAYGLDTTCFQNFFCINNHYFKIVQILYLRGSLQGRSTIVYHLQGMYTCRF